MNEEVKRFISRLRTVNSVAYGSRMTTAGVYARMKRGEYEVVEIDGVKFILVDEGK